MKIVGTKTLLGVVAVLSALYCGTPASAVPITDTVDPTDTLITFGSTPSPCPVGFTCTTSALSFVHDITGGVDGFVVGFDTIPSATVAIHLMDTSGPEGFTFSIGLAQTFSSANVPGGAGSTDVVTFNAASLADLQLDGTIGITVRSTSGSFSFADSLLTAEVTRFVPPIAVPEPATLLLLGTGLAALGWRSRRRS